MIPRLPRPGQLPAKPHKHLQGPPRPTPLGFLRRARVTLNVDFSNFGTRGSNDPTFTLNQEAVLTDNTPRKIPVIASVSGAGPTIAMDKLKGGRRFARFSSAQGVKIGRTVTVSDLVPTEATWFFVFCHKLTTGNRGGQAVFFCGTTSARLSFYHNISANYSVIVDFGDTTTGGRFTIAMPRWTIGTWAVWSVVKRGLRLELYRNGELIGADTAIFKPWTLQGDIFIGTDTSGTPNPAFEGDIGEILLYGAALSPADHQLEVKRLRRKWGILTDTSIGANLGDVTMRYDASRLALAAGATVTNWPNEGSGGSGMDQNTTSGTGPTFRLAGDTPGVYFEQNGFLRTTGAVQPIVGSDYAAFVAVTMTDTPDSYANIFDWGHSNSPNQNFVCQRNNAALAYNFAHYNAASGTSYILTSPTMFFGRFVLGFRKAGTSAYCRSSDGTTSSTTHATAAMATVSRRFNLGGNVDFTRRFRGMIHEVMICEGTFTTDEVDQTVKTLCKKWDC